MEQPMDSAEMVWAPLDCFLGPFLWRFPVQVQLGEIPVLAGENVCVFAGMRFLIPQEELERDLWGFAPGPISSSPHYLIREKKDELNERMDGTQEVSLFKSV